MFSATRLEVIQVKIKLQVRNYRKAFYFLSVKKYAVFIIGASDVKIPASHKLF
jgi:hypothetical protein